MGSLIPVFVAVVGAALTYIFTQRHERKRRSEPVSYTHLTLPTKA